MAAAIGVGMILDRVCLRWPSPAAADGLLAVCGVAALFAVLLAARFVRGQGSQGPNAAERFRLFLDFAPDAILIVDGRRRITLVNPRTEELLGYPKEQLLGRPISDFFHQEQPKPDLSSKSDLNLAALRPPDDREWVARCAGGRQVPVEIAFRSLETPDGPFSITILRDISERKAREQRRAVRHAVRRVLTEGPTPDSALPRLLKVIGETLGFDAGTVWMVDATANVLRAAYAWPSFPPPETILASGEGLPGRAWASGRLVGSGGNGEPNPDLAAAPSPFPFPPQGREGRVRGIAFPIMSGDQVLGAFEFSGPAAYSLDESLAETLSSIGGEVGRFIRHHQGEQAIRASEARKAAILESALDAIVTIDQKGNIVEFNPAAEKMFGYDRAAVLGRPMADLIIPPGLRDKHHQGLARFLAGGPAVVIGKRVEMIAMRADGREFPVEVAVIPIRGDGPLLFTAYIRDLSEHKRLEAQFLQAQKMEAVGRLAGGIAHDFNNLLTIINGYSDVLLSERPGPDESRLMVEEIRKAGERAASLTRQLLAFSRKEFFKPVTLNLNTLLADMEKMLGRLVGEDVEFVIAPADVPSRIKADPGQIEQVIMNLVVNARDAMPQGGRLTVETRNVVLDAAHVAAHPGAQPGPHVLLAVTDTGCGMDEATKARIFEPFFTTKEFGKGTGLGLATVYGIVKQSGGHIEVESAPGRGSTFRIYLPLIPGSSSERQSAPAFQEGRETILLVEDEHAVRALARDILQRYGYTVLEAASGEAALALFGEHPGPIDLLLTDIIMPTLSGVALAQRLGEARPDLKVLYMSGYTDSALTRHGLQQGETNLLLKPFAPEALAQAVRNALDGPAARPRRSEHCPALRQPVPGSV
ncbi:MAG TPA: PAS domain S-box protein [Gemmataceae bacterium]|nr:PAS domain S-box protein [Gemmataceae bacterium]